jgi:pathogenesis-related protein 1
VSDVDVGPVSWDDNVAAFAQSYAAQRTGDCALQHSTGSGYGKNIFVPTGRRGRCRDVGGREAMVR